MFVTTQWFYYSSNQCGTGLAGLLDVSMLHATSLLLQSGADLRQSQGGRAHPREKKISAKFRRKSCPHPLEFFVCTPWNFPSAPLGIFRLHPLGKKCYQFIF
ncbi:hypothetical protein Hanom_Chr12g01170271 [Helianthus anomalus]